MRVLLVENNYSDAIVLAKMLIEAATVRGEALEIVSAGSLSGAVEQLSARPPDALVLDLGLPDAHGLAAFASAHAAEPAVPCVVVTSPADEAAAIESLRCGAQMYLRKSEITTSLLWRAIEYAIRLGQGPESAIDGGRAVRLPPRAEREVERRTNPGDELIPEALAVAVARDLDNLLTVIQSFGRSAQACLPEGEVVRDEIGQVLRAADRAGAIVAELLASARRMAEPVVGRRDSGVGWASDPEMALPCCA